MHPNRLSVLLCDGRRGGVAEGGQSSCDGHSLQAGYDISLGLVVHGSVTLHVLRKIVLVALGYPLAVTLHVLRQIVLWNLNVLRNQDGSYPWAS